MTTEAGTWSGTSEDSLLVAAQEVPDPNGSVV